jgi:hypothetical protein
VLRSDVGDINSQYLVAFFAGKKDNLLTGEGEGGGEPNHMRARKSSMNHSILSDL